MRIAIVTPALPPTLNGIGDHARMLAQELAKRHDVRLVVGENGPHEPITGIDGSEILEHAFSAHKPWTAIGITKACADVDWVVLEYVCHSYSRFGWNPLLVKAMQSLRPKLALWVHETFVPAQGFKGRVLHSLQKAQLSSLLKRADALVMSCEAWGERAERESQKGAFGLARWRVVPSGSSIPMVGGGGLQRADLGYFGHFPSSALLPHFEAAFKAIVSNCGPKSFLVTGPASAGPWPEVSGIDIIRKGILPPAEISKAIGGVDLMLLPFVDGASFRRTSFATALEHGLATLSTRGPLTDAALARLAQKAFVMTEVADPSAFAAAAVKILLDPLLRSRLGSEARAYFLAELAWPVLAKRFEDAIGAGTHA